MNLKYNSMRVLKTILLALIIILFSFDSYSQCKRSLKKCKSKLLPYVHNGQYYYVKLGEGERAELEWTLFSGMAYRALICGQAKLAKIEFQIMDKNKDREVLFDSKFQSYANFWDFTVDKRQEYIFSVSIPKGHNGSSQDERGGNKPETLNKCVILLIGFMDNVEM